MSNLTLADMLEAPTIDVHGYDASGAIFEVDAFCERAWAKRLPAVRVMHGRGAGILRRALLDWTAGQAHLGAEDSTDPAERGAVIYLFLR